MALQNVELVVLDLYGTLVNHHREGPSPFFKLFDDLRLNPEEAKQAYHVALTENFDSLASFLRKIKPQARTQFPLQDYENAIAQEVASTTPYPETLTVLGELRNRCLPLGLISNAGTAYKKPFFALGLDKYFSHIIFSCDIGLQKPDERIYEHLLCLAGVAPPHALMVGDKLDRDIHPPRAIGMKAVLLDREDKSDFSPKMERLEEIFDYL
ncbi:HAD family hydrolase [Candidatus Woesearchaeota archaeon]|nr:HAD family hydrolase [Candidatus Woesearchaeota archaeon]